MKTKLAMKMDAFEYIVQQLCLWRYEYKKEFEEASKKHQNGFDDFFTHNAIQTFPLFICTISKDRKSMYTFFDMFFATGYGIIEKDFEDNEFCILRDYDNYLTSNDNRFLKKTLCIDFKMKNLIDESIRQLKQRDSLFVYLKQDALIFYNQRHTSWFTYMEGKIPSEILIEEKSIFASSIDKMRYC